LDFASDRITSYGKTRFREIEAMTSGVFFWYIFPLIVAAAGLGWLWYDKRFNNHYR